ncbi:hypothetical protein BGW42_001847 [Actinomortierella wolfii]|nr:hypothetical protein BGW42_001847 [Actinomortierella wolfii]
MSIAKQNFSDSAEATINQQITVQLTAAQTFRQMAAYFGQADVSLPGFAKLFSKRADKETEKAQHWINYQNQRGGTVVLDTIPAPSSDWTSAREALGKFLAKSLVVVVVFFLAGITTILQVDIGRHDGSETHLTFDIICVPVLLFVSIDAALQVERDVNKNFLAVSALADNDDDPHLSNTVRSVALAQQVETIEEIVRQITQHDRAGSGLGLYLFDKSLEDEE